MIFDILGVPQRLANVPAETTPSSSREPLANPLPIPPVSYLTPSLEAHEALKALAIADGWAGLYDPTNPDSVTYDGTGVNVIELRDSLGNLPPLTPATALGLEAKPLVNMGTMRAITSLMWAPLPIEQDFTSVSTFSSPHDGTMGYPFTGLDPIDPFTNRSTLVSSGPSASALSSSNPGIEGHNFAFGQGLVNVTSFDTVSGLLHVGKHSITSPDSSSNPTTVNLRPKGIGFGAYSGGSYGPLAVANRGIDESARLRMVELLTRVTNAPTTAEMSGQVPPEAYASMDHNGNLTAAFRPDRPTQIASLTKLLVAYLVRKQVPSANLDQLITVVDPYQSTDNRYPAIYAGDTISWRDAIHLSLMLSHNRLSNVIAYNAGRIINPAEPNGYVTFLAHMRSTLTSWGWSTAVVENFTGHRNSIFSHRHVAELMRKISSEDPWLRDVSGVSQWNFMINRITPDPDTGSSVTTGTARNIVQEEVGGSNFPELVGGKGGALSNPAVYTFAIFWRNPITGSIQTASLTNMPQQAQFLRYANMRRIMDAVRSRLGTPASWSAPQVGTSVDFGTSNNINFVAGSKTAEGLDNQPELIPFDPISEPLPIVRKGDKVTFRTTSRAPYSGGAGAVLATSINLRGGSFENGKNSVEALQSIASSTAWTTTTVSGTVRRGGVLTPRIYTISGDDSVVFWTRNTYMLIETPIGETWVYRLDVSDFSVTEDSQPLDLTRSSGSVGDFDVSVKRPELESVFSEYGHRFLYGKQARLQSRWGTDFGTITDVDLSDHTNVHIVGQSEIGKLNAHNVQAPPFVGNIQGLLQEYIGLIAETAPEFTVDPEIALRPIVVPGWRGNLWVMMKQLCAAQNMQIVSRPNGGIHFEPTPRGVAQPADVAGIQETGEPQTLARAVEVVKYSYNYVEDELVYPAGGWGADTEVITVGPGESLEYMLDLGASVVSFVEPAQVEFVDAMHFATSVYTIVDEAGRTVSPAVFRGAGGTISFTLAGDGRSITLRIKAPERVMMDNFNKQIQSYSLGSRFGDAGVQYSTLRIIGTGVTIAEKTLRIPTGVQAHLTGTDVGATIDNIFNSSWSQAGEAGSRAALTYSGSSVSVSLETQMDPGVGGLLEGGALDYRQRSTTLTPAGASIDADYHLTHDAYGVPLAGMSYDDVADWNDGLTYYDSQNRGRLMAGAWASYDWLGTPDNSASVKKVAGVEVARNWAPDPRCVSTSKYRATGDLTSAIESGIPYIQVRENATGGSLYIDPSINFRVADLALKVGDEVTLYAETRVTVEMTMRLRLPGYSGVTTSENHPGATQMPADGWVPLRGSATITAVDPTGYFRALVWPTNINLPAGEGFDVRRYMVTLNNPDVEYFDGSTSGHIE